MIPAKNETVEVSVQKVEILSWSLMLAMTFAGWLIFSAAIGQALFVGGFLVNVSFWLLKRDLVKLLAGELIGVKARFLLKYYARLSVLAVIFFILIKYVPLNIPALLVGLSTVMVSIVFTMVLEAKKFIGT
ncbi:MAG: ATP synthase subunit I [Desulfobulbaceae bacterium]|nr:ATP synthase subunit I [Desulfobulbaceae bacterium]HIJ79244.1 ATP synthase subunit I [Deltaproteobacteria bacterium]